MISRNFFIFKLFNIIIRQFLDFLQYTKYVNNISKNIKEKQFNPINLSV